jgi:hypothetical protein
MTPSKAGQLALRAAMLLFLGWLYGGDLLLWLGARSAEVAAMSELPRVELAGLGVLVVLFGFGVLSVLQQKPASWRPQRLVSIAVVSLLFFDFVVLSSRKSMLPAEEQAVLAVQALAEGASELSAEEAVLRDPNALQAMADELGAVPYFEAGQRVPGWKVETREGCQGPAGDARSSRAGTFIYCVAGDRKRAWVTLVGTAVGERFGPRVVVSTDPAWVGEVQVKPREAAPPEGVEAPETPPVWDQPTQEDAP